MNEDYEQLKKDYCELLEEFDEVARAWRVCEMAFKMVQRHSWALEDREMDRKCRLNWNIPMGG